MVEGLVLDGDDIVLVYFGAMGSVRKKYDSWNFSRLTESLSGEWAEQ